MYNTPIKISLSLQLFCCLFLLLPTLALTELVAAAALPTVSLVKDINTTRNNSGSYPQEIVQVGNITFFIASTPTTGDELWKSDGTAAGTVMVKDIYPGSGSSLYYDGNFTATSSTLYFKANNGINGWELWKSDGTAVGTVMVKDIYPGMGSGLDYDDHYNFTAIGSMLYFVADNGVNGYELWKSDGTAAGTVMVKDIVAGSGYDGAFCSGWDCDHDHNLTVIGSTLYFAARGAGAGRELWKSDGTAAGTVLVKDIYPGDSSNPDDLTAVGDVLYFRAYNNVNGSELWRSDGTAAGTVLVKDINPGSDGSYPIAFTVVNNMLYFQANNGINGQELWKSDGTSAGTVLVKDIYPGNCTSGDYEYTCGSSPSSLTAVGSTLYFTANDGVNGYELWKSDGTAAGTVMVKDIYPGTCYDDNYNVNVPCYSYPNYLTAVGSTLYFRAYDGVNGYELWKSDGTAAGTVMVKDINPGGNSSLDPFSNVIAVGSTLYFTANNGVNGYELWKSDGTAAGTVMVKDIYPGTSDSLGYFTAIGSTLYFVANDGVDGKELWKSDGTAAGTVLVKDINPTGSAWDNYSYPNFIAVGNVLYFRADNGINGDELWKSDGTAAGTVMVKDINPGTGDSGPYYFAVIGSMLYFLADNGVNGDELWKSDGTEAGTVLVKDIVAGSDSSFCHSEYNCYPPSFTVIGSTLYFIARGGGYAVELWKSDGTAAGTVLVKDINPTGSAWDNYSYPNFIAVGDVLYFRADNGINGDELWKSDGTAAGTVMVKDINPGTGDSLYFFNYPTIIGSTLYFLAYDVNGYELWKSDGTAAGTVLVKDINPGSDSSFPQAFTVVGNMLYFQADHGINGRELWKSDGTSAGTVMVKDINPGNCISYYGSEEPCDSNPSPFTAVGSTLYFLADNGINGDELWKSDGTTAGTIMLKDIWSGVGDSNLYHFTTVGNLFYFQANNGINGDELWQTDGTIAGTQMLELVPGSGGSDPRNVFAIGTKLYFSAVNEATGRELWQAETQTPTPIDGACGSADGGTFNTAPTTNLCNSGTATAVTSTSPWIWHCNGQNGGSDAICVANITTYTVTPNAGTGGTANPSTAQTVNYAATKSFTVTANSGYTTNNAVTGTCPQGSWNNNVWTTGLITANCTVNFSFTPIPINGACGSANGASFNTAPTSNLCNVGTASAVTGTGPWNWNCSGQNGGTTANCAANINRYTITATAGTGGTVNPSSVTVNYGTPTNFTVTTNNGYTTNNAVTGTCPQGSWNNNVWTTGLITANCTVNFSFTLVPQPINGVCGTANGGTFATIPTTNLCSVGTASAVTGTGPWNWNCAGMNGGITANCSANIQTIAINSWLYPTTMKTPRDKRLTLTVTAKSDGMQITNYDYTITFDPNKLLLVYSECDNGVCIGANNTLTINAVYPSYTNSIKIKGLGGATIAGNDLQLLIIHFKSRTTLGATNVTLQTNALENTSGDTIGLGAAGATINISTGICGDANGDTMVNIIDSLAIARKLVGLPPPPTIEPLWADVNYDSNATITDALHIARYSIGLVLPPEVCNIGQPL